MHTLETTRQAPARRSWRRAAARWIVTFAGFPAGGFTAMLLVGHVDSVITALAGGLITGTILGAVQAWGLGRSGPARSAGSPRPPRPTTASASVPPASVSAPPCPRSSCRERYAGWRSARPRRSHSPQPRPDRVRLARGPGGHLGPRLGDHLRRGHRGQRPVHRLRQQRSGGRHRPDRRSPRLAERQRRGTVMSRHVVFGTGQSAAWLPRSSSAWAPTDPGQPFRPRHRQRRAGSRRRRHRSDVHGGGLRRRGRGFFLPRPPATTTGPGISRRCSRESSPAPKPRARASSSWTLYAYGPIGGRDLVESLPANPASAKAGTPGGDDRRTAGRAPGRAGSR